MPNGEDSTIVPIQGIGLGLNTKDRASRIPPGAAVVADNCSVYRGSLRNAPGYARVTNSLPREEAILFDGYRNMLQSALLASSSEFELGALENTVEVLVKTTAITDVQTILYKGSGTTIGGSQTTSTFDWMLSLEHDTSAGTNVLTAFLRIYDSVSVKVVKSHVLTSSGDPILPNMTYWIAFTYDDNAGEAALYVYKPGEGPGTAVTGSVVAMLDTHRRFYVGGQPIADASITNEAETSQYHFQGVIQELRIWDSLRSTSDLQTNSEAQIAATAGVIGYTLTGGDGWSVTDDTGNNVVLYMEPTRARWEPEGLALRDGAALFFDGDNDVIQIPNAYLYRDPSTDAEGQYLAYDSWWLALHVRVDRLRDSVILHSTHLSKSEYVTNYVTSTTMSGTVSFTDERFNWFLEVAEDTTHGGEYEFRFVMMGLAHDAELYHAECVSTDLSTGSGGGIVAGTTYQIMVTYDGATAGPISPATLKIWLDGANSNGTPDTQTVTVSGVHYFRPPPTDDDPIGSAVKYLMVVGGAISQSRKGESNIADPNDIDWQPDASLHFEGAIDQLVLGSGLPPATTTVSLRSKLLDQQYLTRAEIASVNSAILGCWLLNEGTGAVLEDIGVQNNTFEFLWDPKHLRANSLIATLSPGRVLGLVDQHYRTAIGTTKKVLAITTGGIAEVDEVNDVLVHTFDGIRNNSDNVVGTSRWQDTVIICTGEHANVQVWRDELYKLSIDPPTGFIPWGVTDQIDGGKLTRGARTIGFTYWSDFQGKRSPLGTTISVDLKTECNIVLGEDAEILQTHASTVSSLKAPFDLAQGSGAYAFLRIQAWLEGEEGGPGTGDPGNSTVKFTDSGGNEKPWISDKDNVTLEEVKNAIELRAKRAWVDTLGGSTRFKLKSRLLGSDARLQVQNSATGGAEDVVDDMWGIPEPLGGIDVGPLGGGGAVFTTTTITRASGDWTADGFAVGKRVRIETPEDAANEVTETITTISATVITCSGANFTANAGDTTATFHDGDVLDGLGVSNHGISLPFPGDPQVTHIEVWMTLADANADELRLVARVPRGTSSYKIAVPDEQLVGEVLENDLGSVPPVRYVVPFGARRLYFGDPLQPQRLYISEPNRPWFVRNGAVVDFVDGRTLDLKMAIGSEDNVILCKDDAVMVLTPTGDDSIPFQVSTRFRHTGALSAFGAVELYGTALWPDEEGIVQYDTSSIDDVSEVIDDTYKAIDASTRSKIAGVLYEAEKAAGWAAATGGTLVNSVKVNDHVLWWNWETGKGPDGRRYGWTKQTAINAAFWSIVEDADGVDRVLFVDSFGYIHEYGVGKYAGNWDGSAVLTTASVLVASGTSTTVVVPQATLANVPDGYKGFWVTLNHVGATSPALGTRETRLVVADNLGSPSTLTVDHAWDTNPVANDILVVGLMPIFWQSGDMAFGGQARETMMTAVHGTMRDQNVTAGTYVEFGYRSSGRLRVEPTGFSLKNLELNHSHFQAQMSGNARGARHTLRIRGVFPGVGFEIEELAASVHGLGTGAIEGTPA